MSSTFKHKGFLDATLSSVIAASAYPFTARCNAQNEWLKYPLTLIREFGYCSVLDSLIQEGTLCGAQNNPRHRKPFSNSAPGSTRTALDSSSRQHQIKFGDRLSPVEEDSGYVLALPQSLNQAFAVGT